jgi:hypothetical protein
MDLPSAALSYAQRGISVFPLLPRSKAPMVANGFQQATADLAKVRAWWRRKPDCNIGISTGSPAGFWVLDIDGEAAEAALAALEAQHGALPVTVQQTTGRGRHICFRWDQEGPEMRNRSKVGGADIDVRGNGGYIVAPPSMHPGDAKKGIPPGRIYAWSWGRSPEDLPFADAPAWLVELCRPRDQVAPAPAAPVQPRAPAAGRATRYGEVVLDACVAAIQAAQKGARDSTLYRFACKAAGLAPTGHIEASYLRAELVRAGAAHVPDAMSQAQLERQVDRALVWGGQHPWGPDPDRRARPAVRGAPAARSAVDQAVQRAEGARLADSLGTVPPRIAAAWRSLTGTDLDAIPGLEQRLGWDGRNLVLPLVASPGEPPDGVAVFALGGGGACLGLKGLSHRRVGVLAWPEGADQVLVATNLADAWTLGAAAFASDDPMAVVVAPRLSSFAGGPLGDRYGRVHPDQPQPDPDQPAWTRPGMAVVYLAVRRDLRSPELKVRKALGGTKAVTLTGDAVVGFWGGLASAAWRRAGANVVRVLSPPGAAVGFCEHGGGA